MMGILGLLILSLGAFAVVDGSKCIPETAECSRYWVKIEPHKNLLESEKELDAWCRKQTLFYDCLQNVLVGPTGNLSDLPTNLLISKMFSDDLCLDGSNSRKRYLSNAACINQLNTEYCTLPEYLDIVTPDDSIPPSRCSLSEKAFSCIAATMVMNCGFDAGRVYRYLLKVTKYAEEVCDIESSDDVPPCRDSESDDPKREVKHPEIYYGLLDRIGVIPEQSDEADFSPEESGEAEDHESLIAGAIREALDSIEDSSTEEYVAVSQIKESESSQLKVPEKHNVAEQPDLFKTPIITEPFKGLLHYNYSDREFVVYWKQPENSSIKGIECKHVLPSCIKGVLFECVLHRGLAAQACLEFGETEDEDITPELIRDVDPDVPGDSSSEFGPRPYWMDEIDELKRQKLGEFNSVFSDSESRRARSADFQADDSVSTASRREEMSVHLTEYPESKWWRRSVLFPKKLAEEIFHPVFLQEEIFPVFLSDLSEGDIPFLKAFYDNTNSHMYLFEDRLNNFENITCSRVNECHLRGRGIFKCVIKPRVVRSCEPEEKSQSMLSLFDIILELIDVKPLYREITKLKNKIFEGSGSSNVETSSENVVTLLLAANDSPVSEDVSTEGDELVQVEISNDPTTELDSQDLTLTKSLIEELDDESTKLSHFFHLEDVAEGNEEEDYRITLGNHGIKISDENVFVLQPSSNKDGVATYELVKSEDNETLENTDDEY